MSRNAARHRRLFIHKIALLQKRAACGKTHTAEEYGFDPDTQGHRYSCYPEPIVKAIHVELTTTPPPSEGAA